MESTALIASGTRYSHKITEYAKPWDLSCCASHLLGYQLLHYHTWSYYLFNLLKLVLYFLGCLHGNVAAQLFTLLNRYEWLNCTTDVA